MICVCWSTIDWISNLQTVQSWRPNKERDFSLIFKGINLNSLNIEDATGKKLELIDILKNYIDHPSVKRFYNHESEVDILNNNYDEEKVSQFRKEEEFDIIANMISDQKFLNAIESITDYTEIDSGKFYWLSQKKLYSFLESKFDKLIKVVVQDEGGSDSIISEGIKRRTGEILYNDLQSPIIGYSFLIKVKLLLISQIKFAFTLRLNYFYKETGEKG